MRMKTRMRTIVTQSLKITEKKNLQKADTKVDSGPVLVIGCHRVLLVETTTEICPHVLIHHKLQYCQIFFAFRVDVKMFRKERSVLSQKYRGISWLFLAFPFDKTLDVVLTHSCHF